MMDNDRWRWWQRDNWKLWGYHDPAPAPGQVAGHLLFPPPPAQHLPAARTSSTAAVYVISGVGQARNVSPAGNVQSSRRRRCHPDMFSATRHKYVAHQQPHTITSLSLEFRINPQNRSSGLEPLRVGVRFHVMMYDSSGVGWAGVICC